jgi:pimeloyl-ACP methyl ester carboxylesterase
MHTLAALLLSALAGYWSGTVTTPADPLPIGIAIRGDGATLDASALGLVDKPLRAEVRGETLVLEISIDEQPVTAELTVSGNSLRGGAQVGADRFAIALERSAPPVRTWRTEQAVIDNGEVKLASTLYLPASVSRAPAVVFVAGLTPRGDAVHFLATQLASRGIAVLTYDHRGIGGSTGERRASFSDLADDAAAAVRWLRARREIDPERIGIRGQSQGAWIAPLAATRVPVAFIIATAGGAVAPWQSETYAIPARMHADGFSDAEVAEAAKYMAALFEVGRSGKGWDELAAMMAGLRARGAKWFGRYGSTPDSFERLQQTWRNEFSYDPLPALRAVQVPLLALEGEKDVYAPAEMTSEVLRANLKTARVATIKGATHDFHVAGAPLPIMSQEYLSTLIDWTVAQAGLAAPAAATPAASGNRVVLSDPKIVINVDPSLPFLGSFGFDIRDAAHADRWVFAQVDATGNVQRLAVVQFERMLPAHRGAYDAHSSNQRRIGPLSFEQSVGVYNFAASIAAKPGAEAERTRDLLASKGMKVDADLLVARFETLPSADHRSEILLFYWQDLASMQQTRATIDKSLFEPFSERARALFTIGM